MTRTRLTSLLALLLAALLVLPTVMAGGSEDDEEEHDEHDEREWEDEEREVDADVDEDGFRIESRRDSDRGRDAWRAEFDLESGEVDFEFEDGEDSEFELLLSDWVLREYVDADGDGLLGLGEPVLAVHRPATASARTMESEAESMRATYWLDAGGHWDLVFLAPSAPTRIDGVRVAPTELKFDVLVDDYPWQREDAQLALSVRVAAEAEFDEGSRDDLPGLFVNATGVRGFLQWVPNVTVDGAAVPIRVDVAETEFESDDAELSQEARVVFHYPHGQRILHDPSLGVTPAAAAVVLGPVAVGPVGDATALAVGAAVAAVAVGLSLVPSLRRRP